jgi:DNA gyrase subunit A
LNVMFATASGNVRRNNLSDFTNIKRNGKIAMKLQDGDDLVSVLPCSDEDDVLMATRNGKAIRFATNAVRVFRGRDSTGVRGIRLLGDDRVVSMSIIADEDNEFILSVTENGYGKRTPVNDYRRSGRGGQGVANIETSKRNGQVMASFAVVEEDQLMLVTNMGQVIRIRVHGGEGDSIRIASRKTQGVRLFDVADDESEKVVSAGLVRETDSDDDDDHEDNHTEGHESDNNGDQTGSDAGETAAIAPNANNGAYSADRQDDAVDAPSDANNASNQAGDEDNQ